MFATTGKGTGVRDLCVESAEEDDGIVLTDLGEDEGEELPPFEPGFVPVDDGHRGACMLSAVDLDAGPRDGRPARLVAFDLGLGEAELVEAVGVEDLAVVERPGVDEVLDQRARGLRGVGILSLERDEDERTVT